MYHVRSVNITSDHSYLSFFIHHLVATQPKRHNRIMDYRRSEFANIDNCRCRCAAATMNLVVTPLSSDFKKNGAGFVDGGILGRFYPPRGGTSEYLFLTSECLFLTSESLFIWVYNQTLPTKPNLSESQFLTQG